MTKEKMKPLVAHVHAHTGHNPGNPENVQELMAALRNLAEAGAEVRMVSRPMKKHDIFGEIIHDETFVAFEVYVNCIYVLRGIGETADEALLNLEPRPLYGTE